MTTFRQKKDEIVRDVFINWSRDDYVRITLDRSYHNLPDTIRLLWREFETTFILPAFSEAEETQQLEKLCQIREKLIAEFALLTDNERNGEKTCLPSEILTDISKP